MRKLRIAIIALSGVLALAGCGRGRQKSGTTELILGTYNVGVFGKSGSNTTEMVASMMKELGVQVLSLNELDSCTVRHPEFQIKDFAEAMGGWNYNFAPAMDYQGGAYGEGIASCPELTPVRQYSVTLDRAGGAEQRVLAVSVFDSFVFCSTHLDHRSSEAQLSQVRQICAWASANYGDSDMPVFLCGDLNAEPDSETMALIRKDWTILSPLEFSFSAQNPRKCIDYIMVYRNAASRVKLLSSGIVSDFKSGDVTVASDHLPVFVKVKLDI